MSDAVIMPGRAQATSNFRPENQADAFINIDLAAQVMGEDGQPATDENGEPILTYVKVGAVNYRINNDPTLKQYFDFLSDNPEKIRDVLASARISFRVNNKKHGAGTVAVLPTAVVAESAE